MTPSQLALLGGPRAVTRDPGDLFAWPIVTEEDEAAVLEVLRRGAMSHTDVTVQFEREFADWIGLRYTLGHASGTTAILGALFGCGVGVGDEVICPSFTYWASALPVMSLGATIVFADIEPHSLCLDPADLERRITPRTRAVVVVHLGGYPADMDPILSITRAHGVKVIEDVSHAQGGLYKGRKLGTLGDVAAMSLMSGKSFACGEAGILATNDREIHDRALAFGHYERFRPDLETEALRPYAGLPMGGVKHRMNQLSSAMARVQLRHYDRRCEEIRRAMNHFWDLLEGTPGLRAHRVPKGSGSTMAGWYGAHGLYAPEELGGLSVTRFAQAVRAEGAPCGPGFYPPMHLHPLLQTADVYGHGRPTRIAHSPVDVRERPGDLPVTEAMTRRSFYVPWFKRYRPELIGEYAEAYRKVALQYRALLEDDPGDPESAGSWSASQRHTRPAAQAPAEVRVSP